MRATTIGLVMGYSQIPSGHNRPDSNMADTFPNSRKYLKMKILVIILGLQKCCI
jgi:hypothetical protein